MAFYVNIDLMVWYWVNRYWPWPVLRFIIHNNHLFVLLCYAKRYLNPRCVLRPTIWRVRSEAWLFNYSIYDCLLLVWSVVCMFYEGHGLPTLHFFLLTYLHRLSSQLLSALLFCYFAARIVRGNVIAYQENAINFILKREIFCRTVVLHDKGLIAVGWTNAVLVCWRKWGREDWKKN